MPLNLAPSGLLRWSSLTTRSLPSEDEGTYFGWRGEPGDPTTGTGRTVRQVTGIGPAGCPARRRVSGWRSASGEDRSANVRRLSGEPDRSFGRLVMTGRFALHCDPDLIND